MLISFISKLLYMAVPISYSHIKCLIRARWILGQFMQSFELDHDRVPYKVLSSILSEMNSALVEHLHHSVIVGLVWIEHRCGHVLTHFVQVLLYNKCIIIASIWWLGLVVRQLVKKQSHLVGRKLHLDYLLVCILTQNRFECSVRW